jgi:predicted lipoprotein with Yx(FWY)xxD motif
LNRRSGPSVVDDRSRIFGQLESTNPEPTIEAQGSSATHLLHRQLHRQGGLVNPIIRKAALASTALAVLVLPACGAYKTASNDSSASSGDYGAPVAAADKAPAGSKTGKTTTKTTTKPGKTTAKPGTGAAAPVPKTAAPKAAPNALIARNIPKMGTVVTDVHGWTLYRFDRDKAKPPTTNCNGKCAQIWPPALTDGNPKLVGVNPLFVGTLRRADGTLQLTLRGWPLYRYIGDPRPGAWKGQNVGGTWFVSAPDGSKNLTCLPPPHPPVSLPAAPASTPPTKSTDSGGSYGGGTY